MSEFVSIHFRTYIKRKMRVGSVNQTNNTK